MKMVAPLSNFNELDRIIAAGADEIYCGVQFDGWEREFGDGDSSNARHFSSNLSSLSQLDALIKKAHARSVKIKVVLNESYSWTHYRAVVGNIEKIIACEPDEIIASDMGLIYRLSRSLPSNINLAVSTMAAAFNSRAVGMYRDMGAKRIILPRQVSLKEIAFITGRFPDLEFEAMILNSKCKGICAFCSFDHCVGLRRLGGGLNLLSPLKLNRFIPHKLSEYMRGRMERGFFGCCLDYRISPPGEDAARLKALFERPLDASGAYALKELSRSGVGFVKIAGRELTTARKLRDIRFLRAVMDSMELADDEFESRTLQLHRRFGYTFKCAGNLYYNVGPEAAVK